MTKEEINENNELIAKFKGITNKDDILSETLNKPMYRINGTTTNLRYNSSWDWLMLVVEKIESLQTNVIITNYSCEIYTHTNDYSTQIVYPSKIEAVWHSCIQFIKWYNDNRN